MEVVHVAVQLAAQFVDARQQRLEVVAVFDAGVLGASLDPFTLQANQVDAQDSVVVSCQFSRSIPDEQIQQRVYVDASLFDHFSRYFSHASTFLPWRF